MPCVSHCSHVAVALSILLCQLRLSTTTKQPGTPNKPPNYPYPCMPAEWPSAYDTFLKRHLTKGQPHSLDQNQWQRFIQKNHLCGRPTQSFLRFTDKQQVLGVCSPDGGRTLRDNLCISGRKFTFNTIHINKTNCDIQRVEREDKYIILACSNINGTCLPIHFEGNPENLKPDKNQPPCQRPQRSEAELPMSGWVTVMPLLGLPWLMGL